MKAPSASEAPSGRLKSSSRIMKKMTAAVMPRMNELRQVGGRSAFATGLRLPPRARALASARLRGLGRGVGVGAPAVGGAAFAGAFFLGLGHSRNLFGRGREPPLDQVPLGVEAADRHVRRVAGQSGGGGKADPTP